MTDKNGARSSSKREIFCVHCGCNVSKSTFYRHRAEFFDPVNNVWSLSPNDHVSNVLTASGSGDATHMATETERPTELEEHSDSISSTNQLCYEEFTPASDPELYSDHSEQSFDLQEQPTGSYLVLPIS